MVEKIVKSIDWLLVIFLIPILGAGLITMSSFTGDSHFFTRQLLWIIISLVVFFVFSFVDFRFLRRTNVIVTLFTIFCGLLIILFAVGHVAKGAQSWFSLGGFSFQPSDLMKLVLILILSKYFSRRHVEIAHPKHIFISGLYAFIPLVLVLLQPDFGSVIILFFIWLGMALVAGISKKHLLLIFGIGAVAFMLLWSFVFLPYQKARITSFIHPLADIHKTGYNAYQSAIAVGSGQIVGKGVGYGTQSRLSYLPEYQTDFIFAAFTEEWGFIGALILFILYGLVMWRIIVAMTLGATNFEILFAAGVAIMFMVHIFINIGMNITLMPVTGITLPFMSYGGSHLLMEFSALGILMGMRRYGRAAHPDEMKNEFLGL